MKTSKKLLNVLSGALILLIAGCASMPKKGDYIILETPPLIEEKAEAGQIYFFREKSFIGGGISYYINEAGQRVGMLRSGSYFILQAPVGQHTYSAETESKTTVLIDVQSGKKYYVQGGVTMGALIGRPSLELVTEDYATPLITGLDYVKLNKQP